MHIHHKQSAPTWCGGAFFVFLGAFFNCYSLYFPPQKTYFLTFLHFFLNFEPKNFRTYNKICIFAPSNEKNTGFRK